MDIIPTNKKTHLTQIELTLLHIVTLTGQVTIVVHKVLLTQTLTVVKTEILLTAIHLLGLAVTLEAIVEVLRLDLLQVVPQIEEDVKNKTL